MCNSIDKFFTPCSTPSSSSEEGSDSEYFTPCRTPSESHLSSSGEGERTKALIESVIDKLSDKLAKLSLSESSSSSTMDSHSASSPHTPESPFLTPLSIIGGSVTALESQPKSIQTTNQAVKLALEKANTEKNWGKAVGGMDLKAIKTGGGHGGFYLASVQIPNLSGQLETFKLFLKPFDQAEFNNFTFIQKQCEGHEEASIHKYMPRMYEKVTLSVPVDPEEPDGPRKDEDFMVMGNLFNTDDGREWSQVSDLKITRGGQFDKHELQVTRANDKEKQTKTPMTAALMRTQSALATNYLTLTKSKFARTLNALDSSGAFLENLKSTLEKIPPEYHEEVIKDLTRQYSELRLLMKKSPMGFIGASVFIFVTPPIREDMRGETVKRELKIYLADPAHGIADPATKDTAKIPKEQIGEMYWGKHRTQEKNTAQFLKRIKYNQEAILAMNETAQTILCTKIKKVAKADSSPPEQPDAGF